MIEKPTAEFFETLGNYVYQYRNDRDKILYVGKGVGDRCLHHIKDKGYDIENCYIVARNLEQFSNKPSLLLESYLISSNDPEDNIVSGHYSECFEMARVVSLFSAYKQTKHDNFDSFPDWYLDNYVDTFKDKINLVEIRSNNFHICSCSKDSLYLHMFVVPNEEEVKMMFEISAHIKGELLTSFGKDIKEQLEELNLECNKEGSTNYKWSTTCNDIESALSLFRKFFGSKE